MGEAGLFGRLDQSVTSGNGEFGVDGGDDGVDGRGVLPDAPIVRG